MTTFFGDVETFSEIPISRGSYRYAEECEIMLFSWAMDEGEIIVEDLTLPGASTKLIAEAIGDADEVVFHHSTFDRAVLSAQAPDLCAPLYKWRDTMVMALSHGMPGALGKLCTILDVPVDKAKMDGGKALINLFCKPRPKNSTLRRATRKTHPVEWAQFVDYAGHDISAMRHIWHKLPRWNYIGSDLALWHLDQRINDRGVPVDMDMVAAAIRTVEREQKRLAERTQELTDGELRATTQRDKLIAHFLKEYGVDLPDLKSDTIKRRLEDENLPWQVKALLANRLQAAAASSAKYKAIERSVNKDGRVRGTAQFNGAIRTHRWAHRGLQPGNLMRTPKYLANEAAGLAREAIKEGFMDLVYEKPMEVLSASVPWAIAAKPGKKIVVADLHQVESRVMAWLAGEQWKLDAFAAQDADPENLAKDSYIKSYARTFGEPLSVIIADYEAGGQKRQIGKVQELALGFGGSVGAFATMAVTYNIDLDKMVAAALRSGVIPDKHYNHGLFMWKRAVHNDETYGLERVTYVVIDAFVQMWREASPMTVQLWDDLQTAFRQAIRNPGQRFTVGRLSLRQQGSWLGMKLPSGGTLVYPGAKIRKGKLTFRGPNPYTRKWATIDTYGGKIGENATQASATGSMGILGLSMPPAEEAGYAIVSHSHDELAAEVPDTDEYTHEELGAIMAAGFDWTDGLPLSAGGYESYFYRKD